MNNNKSNSSIRFLNSFKGCFIFILLLLLWKIACDMNIWTSYILPSPEKVYNTFIKSIKNKSLLINIYASIKRVFIGFLASSVMGIPLGILFGLKENLYQYFKTLFNFFRNTPPLALIPMLILWFGIGEESKIIIIILASFFPIFLNTLKGITSCDKKLIEVGKSLMLSRYEIIKRIIIPNSITYIIIGLRLGMGYSFRAIIGAELVAASSGLGYLISDAKEMSRTDLVIVGIITIGLLGILCDNIFLFLINKFGQRKNVKINE